MSAEVELDLPGKYQSSIVDHNRYFFADFPEDFSTEMSKKDFLLFVNANGIHYKVCKTFKGIQREKKFIIIALKVHVVFLKSSVASPILLYYNGWILVLISFH